MHIAIDARFINSGTGTYVRELLNHLQNIDTENRYSVLVPTKDLTYWIPHNENFSLVACDFKAYSFAEQFGYRKFLDNLGADLVHFAMPQQPVFWQGKRVTTIHDMTLFNTYNSDKNWFVFHAKQFIGRWVFKRIAKISDHLIAISNNTKREYQEFTGAPDDKMSVIYEAGEAHPSTLKPYNKLPFESFILYVGQQPDYKNIRRLGDAHQLLLKKYPDLGLVLVGRKQPAVLANERYFASKQYKNIHFTDFIPDEQRDWLFTKTRAYIFPSLMEGFGLPPLEAMAYGTPVISSNASCMPEILGEAAHYFNPLNREDMASAIDTVLSDETLRTEMIERGYRQTAKYSWERMAQETHAIYLNVLHSSLR